MTLYIYPKKTLGFVYTWLTMTCMVICSHAAFAQKPTITSFSPASGPVGTSVIISGSNFNTTAQQNAVYFGAVRATVTAASASSLTVTVPSGATYQYLTVTNLASRRTAYSLRPFTVTLSGALSFKAGQNQNTAGTANGTVIADIDGDGKSDVVVTTSSTNNISVFRNTSTGGVLSFAARVDSGAGSIPEGIATGDIDGDGKLDVVITNRGSNTVSVFRNTSTPGIISFATRSDFTAGIWPTSVAVGDINSDGKADIVVANNYYSTISVYQNNSSGAGNIAFFSQVNYDTYPGPFHVVIGDLDGDGKPDVATANNSYYAIKGRPTEYNLSLFRNTSGNATTLANNVDITVGNILKSISIADFDADGKQDLMVASQNENLTYALRNQSTAGTFSFATPASFAVNSTVQSHAVADIDGDGKPDVAAHHYLFPSRVVLLRNTSTSGTIGFAGKQEVAAGSGPLTSHSIAIGDLNGDNKPDIAVCTGTSVMILEQKTPLAPPTGQATQYFCSENNPKVANLVANGTGIEWYIDPIGGSPIPSTTQLTNNTTYYASQNINGNLSDNRLAVLAIINPTATWLGATAAWNLPGNWSTGIVPGPCTRVVINNGVNNMPTISGTNNTCFSVTLNNGATITMAAGARLNITGK